MVAFVSDWHHPDGIDADNPRGQPLSMAWCMSVDDARRIAEALNLQEAGKAVEAESLEEVGFLPIEPELSDRVAALRSRWGSSARVINKGKPHTANATPDPAE